MRVIFATIALYVGVVGAASLINNEEYLQRARELVDEYMAEQMQGSGTGGAISDKRPTKRTKELLMEQMRSEAEVMALLKLAMEADDMETVRALESDNVEVFSRVSEDPLCKLNVDCSKATSRNVIDKTEYRTMTGSCNNLDNFSWGMAGIQHAREIEHDYDNPVWNLRNSTFDSPRKNPELLPSPRAISEAVHRVKNGPRADSTIHTLALFQWGQFLDHDMVATPEGNLPRGYDCCKEKKPKANCLLHRADENDSVYPAGQCFPSRRSLTVRECGKNVRNQINELTAYIDASNVYGNSKEESDELRAFISGFMKTTTSDFLPEAHDPSEVACDASKLTKGGHCLLAGDFRVNVQPGLATFHTVFVRLHNIIAKDLSNRHTDWDDDKLFQQTRKIVGALMQIITYNEFLPTLLDEATLEKYKVTTPYEYDDSLDASIFQSFSLAYRFHNMIPSLLHMTNNNGTDYEVHNMELTWLNPSYLFHRAFSGPELTLNGLAFHACPHATRFMAEATRDKLFGHLDLAALNIIRGRDWGTNSYTEFRAKVCGLSNVTSFDGLVDHPQDAIDALESVYANAQDIDLWTGIVTETPVGDSMAGPTQTCLVAKQFANLKHGDRFWYETKGLEGFTPEQVIELNKMTLAGVFCEAMGISHIQREVFKMAGAQDRLPCTSNRIPKLNLAFWGPDGR